MLYSLKKKKKKMLIAEDKPSKSYKSFLSRLTFSLLIKLIYLNFVVLLLTIFEGWIRLLRKRIPLLPSDLELLVYLITSVQILASAASIPLTTLHMYLKVIYLIICILHVLCSLVSHSEHWVEFFKTPSPPTSPTIYI